MDATIDVYEVVFRSVDDDTTAIELAFRTLPQLLQSVFEHRGMPAEHVKTYKPMFEGKRELVKKLHENGLLW